MNDELRFHLKYIKCKFTKRSLFQIEVYQKFNKSWYIILYSINT